MSWFEEFEVERDGHSYARCHGVGVYYVTHLPTKTHEHPVWARLDDGTLWTVGPHGVAELAEVAATAQGFWLTKGAEE